MPSLKAIRLRIASVKNTQKITKAMKLVAAARLRRAQQRITELRPYAQKVAEVLASVASRASEESDEKVHPLLKPHEATKKAALLVLTSDRGLAGAFNSNAQRAADRRLRELSEQGIEVKLFTLGRKGRDFFRRKDIEPAKDYTGAYDKPEKRAPEIAREIMAEFESGELDLVEVIFTEFKSAIAQKVRVEQVLPVKLGGGDAAEKPEGEKGLAVRDENAPSPASAGPKTDYIYEPDKAALLDRLLPMYVEVTVMRAMLDSLASEHGSRMTAMDNATNNAKTMINSLTLQYNRARQAAITKELMEIIGGAEALKG